MMDLLVFTWLFANRKHISGEIGNHEKDVEEVHLGRLDGVILERKNVIRKKSEVYKILYLVLYILAVRSTLNPFRTRTEII